jgi:hypothetical protein
MAWPKPPNCTRTLRNIAIKNGMYRVAGALVGFKIEAGVEMAAALVHQMNLPYLGADQAGNENSFVGIAWFGRPFVRMYGLKKY